jgi:F0F1-type ATP synthase assembly protein I
VKDLLESTPLLQMGWIVAFSTLLPLGIGVLLDRRFGTAPLFILIGAVVGIILSTVGAVRLASRTIDALGERPARPDTENGPVRGKED